MAFGSIKANRLRAVITMLIISVGITSLIGTLSAIDAIKYSINANFARMGANSFTIRTGANNIRVGQRGQKAKPLPIITLAEARKFKEEFKYPVTISISAFAEMQARVKYANRKTNPNIIIFGADENYISTAGYELEKGRNLTPAEMNSGAHVVIIGKEVERALFKNKVEALDKVVRIGPNRFTIIGVLKSKGSSAGMGGDKMCVIPIHSARQYYGANKMKFRINVMANNARMLNLALGEATGTFRRIRHLTAAQDDNFEIIKSDNLATMLISSLGKVTAGATIIGLVTLLGAAIGLMNIMFVSVTERTREIGIRKSMGATQQIIRNQFLIESVVICVSGGLFGIILGIVLGNFISFSFDTGFFVPWLWVGVGFFICILVGLLSGYLPAKRASQLDPIESLRFE